MSGVIPPLNIRINGEVPSLTEGKFTFILLH
jgi:hypothetical protein